MDARSVEPTVADRAFVLQGEPTRHMERDMVYISRKEVVGEIIDESIDFILNGLYRERQPGKGFTNKEIEIRKAARHAILSVKAHLHEVWCADADTLLKDVPAPKAVKLKGEATWDALRDQFDEVVALYECSGCHRWFHPGDTFVTGDGVEYCYDDDTGNGCIVKFIEPDKLAELGIRPRERQS